VEEEEEWIEFETLAVTKQEWLAMSTRFAKSKHPDEKGLHQFLQGEVLPKVMADIEEVEKQQALEAALANRKRSSRIALKESEREERERDRVARLKMEEKMAAIRAEEAQKAVKEREELDAAKVREERIRDREERMAAREREAIEKAERDIMERENREKMREMRKMKREQLLANGGLTNESEELQQHKEQDDDSWELNCEVCGKAGINLDDTEEIVCCEQCGVWQHTECWNAFDRRIGRPARDWEKEDFFCSKCKPLAPGQLWPEEPTKAIVQGTTTSSIAPPCTVPSQSLGPDSNTVQQHPGHSQQTSLSSNTAQSLPTTHNNNNVRPPIPSVLGHSPAQPTSQEQSRPMQHHTTPTFPLSYDAGHYNGHQYTPNSVQSATRQPIPQSQVPPQHMQRPPPMPSSTAPVVNHASLPTSQITQAPLPSMKPIPSTASAPQSNLSSGGNNNQSMAAPTAPSSQTAVNRTAVPFTLPSKSTQASTTPVANSSPHGLTTNNLTQSREVTPVSATSTIKVSTPTTTSMRPPTSTASPSPQASTSVAPLASSPGSVKPSPPSPNSPSTNTNSISSSNVPNRLNSQPSGSFPLRHTMAKSPLSRPEGYTSPAIPQMSLGPAIGRAGSPSPIRPSANSKADPLYSRQTVMTSNSNQSVGGVIAASSPGPSSGSLARVPNPMSISPSPLASSHATSSGNVTAAVPQQRQQQQQQQTNGFGQSVSPRPSIPTEASSIERTHQQEQTIIPPVIAPNNGQQVPSSSSTNQGQPPQHQQ
jgi:hypothetical protein